jgi:heterotetrameric sarcosine oxidase delta subunit
MEFTYGGDATLTRPAIDASVEAWAAFVYLRDNPAGPHDEFWFHAAGCRQWFRVRRDTRTHEILDRAPPATPRSGDTP